MSQTMTVTETIQVQNYQNRPYFSQQQMIISSSPEFPKPLPSSPLSTEPFKKNCWCWCFCIKIKFPCCYCC